MSANPMWGDDWGEARRLWLLDPDIAHCNHGSFGAVPAPVLATQDEFRRRMAANPMRWFDRDLPGLVKEARANVARFVGAGPEEVAFVSNASAGVSAVAQSLSLRSGDEVLSSDHIYGAVSSTLSRLCARTGATRVVADVPLECSDDEVVALFALRCSERTRLIVADQVTSPTARRFPVEELAQLAHSVGAAILVDGAHAPGMLNLEVPKLGADFWVGNLHKWACAPAGTGVLWVGPRWREQMLSLVVSWGEADGFPTSFERVGTDDLSAWLAAPSALSLLGSLGWERVRAHNEALVRWAQGAVASAIGTPHSLLRHDRGLSMAVVPLPRGTFDTQEEAQVLKDHMVGLGVEMAVVCWRGRSTIRLSAHVYNQPSDYDRLGRGVRDFLAEGENANGTR
jgi:isopenicillin-N epimerase